MFIRTSRSGGHTYLRLVESYRDEQGHTRHRQIAQLGRADQLTRGKVDGLIASLHRLTGRTVPADAPHFERAREVGGPWLLTELWNQLGLGKALRRVLYAAKRRIDAEHLIRAMVFNRLCDPDSKLGVLRWLKTVVIPGVPPEGIIHQHLLRAMDVLEARRARFDRAISARLWPLIDQELAVVFYDLTTIRIHGETELDPDLRCYGRSKELKGAARQCMLGLIQTAEGLPLDFALFEGNVAEVKTLLPMLKRCLTRYPIRRVVVVADRGLLSLDNVGELEQLRLKRGQSLEYILAVPAGRYTDFAEALKPLSFPAEAPSVRETQVHERRVVIAHDPETAAAQRQRRRKKVDELVACGERLAQKLDAQDEGRRQRGRRASDRGVYRRFTRAVWEAQFTRFIQAELEAERFCFTVDEAAIERAERLDGKLVLLTNVRDLAAEAIVARYKALADIERGFRVLKSEIEIAPVHHRLPERLRAHAMICFLALLLHRVLRQRLKHSGSPFSVEQALRSLESIQLHQVTVNHQSLRGLTTLTPEQITLFDQLGVSRPRPTDL